MATSRSGRSGAGDQHEACAEELASLREFRRDMFGVQGGSVLVCVLMSCAVRTEAVFVDDMKEVAHADGVGRCAPGFQ